MDEHKRVALWEAYFEADFRCRYFIGLKDALATRISGLGIAVAVLSCGPLVVLLGKMGDLGYQVASIAGVIAGLIGVYLGASGVTKKLATATRAATEWSRASVTLQRLWTRARSGKDVWSEFIEFDSSLQSIDAAAIEHLQRNEKLEAKAWKEAEAALAA